ncbi:MAG: peptidoglycan-binding domain-containing protein, partial [Pseudomonadales bacterium]
VPATYKTVTERVLVAPARTEWKKGRGPIQKIDSATGEIMCLVEIPAQYRTVTKRVVDTPASVRSVQIPAKTKTITRRVIDTPATTRSVAIPATYTNVKVKKVTQPAAQRTIEIPGKSETITKRVRVSDEKLEWRSILCETNTTAGVIQRLQGALRTAGYNPGPIDGVLGIETMAAVNRYQKANNMASGQLTMDTLRKLGVQL